MRARRPTHDGYVERDGVPIHFETFGVGEPAIVFLPTWEIVHSRTWKCQVPYFARQRRTVTFDRRGSGRSGRPRHPRDNDRRATTDDALAVLDRVGVSHAVLVSWCGA